MLLFYWRLLLLVKIDADEFEVNMTNYCQDIKKQFLWQLTVPPIMRNRFLEEKYFAFFLIGNINREFHQTTDFINK